MNLLYNFGFKQIIKLFNSSPNIAINYILQSVFFGLAISSFTVLLLRTIKFSYAKAIVDNKMARLIIIFLFCYIKVWDQWSNWFSLVGYLCSIFVCLYTYDCCLNISQYYANNVYGFYWVQVTLYCTIGMILPLVLLYKYDQKQQQFMFVALAIIALLIVAFNAIKNRHIIHSVVPVITMLVTALLRTACSHSVFIYSIPLYTIPIIMMAFDAQYRQNIANNQLKNKDSKQIEQSLIIQILKGCTSFMLYVMLNGNRIHIEHVLGIMYVLISVIKIR